jgi:hypothetical protein
LTFNVSGDFHGRLIGGRQLEAALMPVPFEFANQFTDPYTDGSNFLLGFIEWAGLPLSRKKDELRLDRVCRI